MAEALGVSFEELLIVSDEKPRKKKAPKSNGRPAGKVPQSSIVSPNYPAVSRNTPSTGFLLMSLNTSNPDNDPIDGSALHFLNCLEFP